MIGVVSPSAGTLIIPSAGHTKDTFVDLIHGEKIDPDKALYMYSAAQDWKEIAGPDTKALLKYASDEYWVTRSASLLRMLLGGLDESLAIRVIQEVENILEERFALVEKISSRLLVAPLKNTSFLESSAKQALSKGFTATAALLDELKELQPFIARFTDIWLRLPDLAFSHFAESKEAVWVKVIEASEMRKLLKATSRNDFVSLWNLLTFHFTSPQSRAGINVLAHELAQELYPHEDTNKQITELVSGSEESDSFFASEEDATDYEQFQKATRQVFAITEALSQGQDTKAEKFLRELIFQQSKSSNTKEYLVKSLSNIAQKCAEMFRFDFEFKCLEEALTLNPHDAWALIQYGDHLKRVGNYELALKTLAEAELYGENEVAKSSEADVYSQQGDYSKSILTYRTIPNWREKPEVITAIADNLRRMGLLELAEAEYKELIEKSQNGLFGHDYSDIRAKTGIAEIAKRRGEFQEAAGIYNQLIDQSELNDRELLYCKLGLANILKISGDYDEAYKIADEVIQQYPFALEARFLRGSILGLIGREREGLLDLPDENRTDKSWREWLRHYYRGLLLLKLDRYDEAKKDLVDEFPNAVASSEEKTVLRMAAALWYITKDDVSSANEKLSEISDLHDSHAKYLSLVLKLHCATIEDDKTKITSLRKEILGLRVVDVELRNAVIALEKKEFTIALQCEADSFLKLAA